MNDLKQTETHLKKLVRDVRSGKRGLFAIATCCATLLNERAAYAEMLNIDESEVADHLTSTYLQDFAVDALELQALLTHYPSAEQWNRPLRELLAETKKSAKKREGDMPRTRRTFTIQEREELEEKVADIEAQKAHVEAQKVQVESQKVQLQSRLDQLQAENSELRAENVRLKGRIEELERILDRTMKAEPVR